MTTSYSVELAVYDLSHGMVRQLLGPNSGIDIVPHTGIVVFGREYFFGGGIQHQDPHEFRRSMGIHPVQLRSLGSTTVTRSQFEAWCQECTRQGRFTMASYDLLSNNCNNFCHAAATEGLRVQGVPTWILDVPSKFMATPMGQMVRPMLENMQVGGAGIGVPFASAPSSSIPAASTPTVTSAPTVVMGNNPWANIPATTSTTNNTISTEGTTVATTTSYEKCDRKTIPPATPLLDSFTKPLLSSDSKTAEFCIKKLTEYLSDNPQAQQSLMEVGECLKACTSSGSRHSQASATRASVEKACGVVHDILQSSSNQTTFALMLLRVLVLHHDHDDGSSDSCLKNCLEWIHDQLLIPNKATTCLTSHAARSMAWLTMANAAAYFLSLLSVEPLVEAALAALLVDSQPRVEVRQAVAAFLYNVVLQTTNITSDDDDHDLPVLVVSLLCASLEDFTIETDATTRLRRLMVAARIVQPHHGSSTRVNVAAKSLVNDLGFGDCIQGIAQGSTGTTGNAEDAERCKTLARELSSILQ